MSILSKTLYKKYGIIISNSESDYFDFILRKNKNIKKSLYEFSRNCETRYFCVNKINEISKNILKEEIGRDIKTSPAPDGKGPAGNITDTQLIASEDGLYIEDTVDTVSGKDAVYLEDEDENNVYKEMEEEYVNVFTKNMRTKSLNK